MAPRRLAFGTQLSGDGHHVPEALGPGKGRGFVRDRADESVGLLEAPRHESITTIDTYGHLVPAGNELASQIIDTALRGEEIHPAPATKLIPGGRNDGASDDAGLAGVSRKSGTTS